MKFPAGSGTRFFASIALASVALWLPAGCGEGGNGDELIVSAASSLEDPFTTYVQGLPGTVRQSFAGSDTLAAQIRNGARPDVYASADVRYPQELFRAGLVDKPRVFAGNRLVIATPTDSDLASLQDLTKGGVKIVTGDDSVPIGIYTAELLADLPKPLSSAIAANVRSREPDVSSVIGKLTQGGADAGFVYATDVLAAKDELKAIPIPARLQPAVAYSAAVVKGSANPDGARAFVDGLIDGEGAAALRAAGFLPPP